MLSEALLPSNRVWYAHFFHAKIALRRNQWAQQEESWLRLQVKVDKDENELSDFIVRSFLTEKHNDNGNNEN